MTFGVSFESVSRKENRIKQDFVGSVLRLIALKYCIELLSLVKTNCSYEVAVQTVLNKSMFRCLLYSRLLLLILLDTFNCFAGGEWYKFKMRKGYLKSSTDLEGLESEMRWRESTEGGNGYGAIKKGRIGGEQKVNGMLVVIRLRRALLRELE